MDFERVIQDAIDHQPVDVAPAHYYGQIGREYGQREAREDGKLAMTAIEQKEQRNRRSMARAVEAVAEEMYFAATEAEDANGTGYVIRTIDEYRCDADRLLKIVRGAAEIADLGPTNDFDKGWEKGRVRGRAEGRELGQREAREKNEHLQTRVAQVEESNGKLRSAVEAVGEEMRAFDGFGVPTSKVYDLGARLLRIVHGEG